MSFEILTELDEVIEFFPKLDMTVDTEGDDIVSFGRRDDIVDGLSMHKTNLVEI